jgi:hypothetical protein
VRFGSRCRAARDRAWFGLRRLGLSWLRGGGGVERGEGDAAGRKGNGALTASAHGHGGRAPDTREPRGRLGGPISSFSGPRAACSTVSGSRSHDFGEHPLTTAALP